MEMSKLLLDAGATEFAALPARDIPPLAGRTLPDGTKSAFVCIFPYFAGFFERRNIAIYAVGPDYHRIVKGMLDGAAKRLSEAFPDYGFSGYVDVSPIDEKAAAYRAGLGEIGLNGLLISPRWGQFVFIGCILTDLPYEALHLGPKSTPVLCSRCGQCREACPTGALDQGRLDRSICRSAITQKKGELTEWESAQIAAGGFAWGCDICQEACPHNSSPAKTPIAEFRTELLPKILPGDLDSISDKAYLWRGRNILRRNLKLIGF